MEQFNFYITQSWVNVATKGKVIMDIDIQIVY